MKVAEYALVHMTGMISDISSIGCPSMALESQSQTASNTLASPSLAFDGNAVKCMP